jgi:hypothetical protein
MTQPGCRREPLRIIRADSGDIGGIPLEVDVDGLERRPRLCSYEEGSALLANGPCGADWAEAICHSGRWGSLFTAGLGSQLRQPHRVAKRRHMQ